MKFFMIIWFILCVVKSRWNVSCICSFRSHVNPINILILKRSCALFLTYKKHTKYMNAHRCLNCNFSEELPHICMIILYIHLSICLHNPTQSFLQIFIPKISVHFHSLSFENYCDNLNGGSLFEDVEKIMKKLLIIEFKCLSAFKNLKLFGWL